jgi:hypothetical protein
MIKSDTILSRRDITVESLRVERPRNHEGNTGGRLRFYDDSVLIFEEVVIQTDRRTKKPRYRYHYQRDDGTLIFRYDSSPHYPG